MLCSFLLYSKVISSLVAQRLKHLPPMWETWVWSLGREDPLEKEMVTHSSILAWRIPWMEKPGRLQSIGSQRVGHDWVISLSLSYLNSLVVSPTFFNLAIKSSWSEPQLGLVFVFADCIEFSIFDCKEYNQSDFIIDHLVMSMCRFFSSVVGRGRLLWPVHSIGKTLLAFELLCFVLQGQICLLFQVSLDLLLSHSSPL